jgi:hypothetical protein
MRGNKQSGMATVSTLFLVAIVGFFLTVLFKLAPHYLDNRMIQATINQVGESNINGKSKAEIRNKIANFFTINNIRDVNIATIAIDRTDAATRISLDYEKRIVMFGNVDVVLSFSNQYDSAE